MFVKNPTESLVFLALWLIKQCSCLERKKKCPLQRRLIAKQQSEAERWTFKAITELSHINWKKSLYLVCPEQWSQCCTVPSFQSAVTKYYRSWFRSDAGPFLAACLLLTAANQKHINIYLDKCHTESWCLWTTARWIWTSCEYNLFLPTVHEQMSWWHEHFCEHTFLMIIIQADSWREKWSIPSCRASIWRPTCCLFAHALHCSLNSAVFQAESALPGDHPLWDQSTERERIWGARLSGLWGVIPQINMEIMCKACVPIMLSHFFSETTWNLCEAMHDEYNIQSGSLAIWWMRAI